MEALEQLPIDTTFTIGDLDLATNLFRTDRLRSGWTLSWVMTALSSAFSIGPTLLPATDDRVRTMVRLTDGSWIGFQEYFVHRGHLDEINDVRFEGADVAKPAPGVMEAIEIADLLVIGPSNPPLSIWPILSIKAIAEAAAARGRVVAVSPLIGGTALKGPAHRVLRGLGFPAGNAGVVAAYGGLLTDLYVDVADGRDAGRLDGLRVHVADTHLADPAAAVAFATKLIESG
jgi:LPPG:FO 2-phospho-L-lactate transferase